MIITDIVTLVANIALTLTFLVGLVFGILQVKAVERERRERLTVDVLRVFQTREFAEFLNFFRTVTFPKTQEELNMLPERQQIMYIQFSQQMESLGILVAQNIVDLDIVDRTLGDFVTFTWKKYEPRFSQMRKNDPYLGEYFQWLAERTAEYSTTYPRDPYYKQASSTRV